MVINVGGAMVIYEHSVVHGVAVVMHRISIGLWVRVLNVQVVSESTSMVMDPSVIDGCMIFVLHILAKSTKQIVLVVNLMAMHL